MLDTTELQQLLACNRFLSAAFYVMSYAF